MARLTRRLFVAALLLAIASLAWGKPRAEHVFIISLDGGRPSVLRESRMPVLERLASRGAATWQAQTIFPSITLVAHTSMLTGVSPKKHHIDWNDWIPEKGLVKVPTVFQVAKKQGLTTGLIAGKDKFQHLNLPGSLDMFSLPGYGCDRVAAEAAHFIADYKPNLCFIHFADTDGAGHSFGWGSQEQKDAFAKEDRALAVVLKAIDRAGIAKSSVVIVTADHGGHAKTHGSAAPEDMTIPWVASGAGVRRSHPLVAPITGYDTAATALWLLDVPIPEDWDGKPVKEAFEPD